MTQESHKEGFVKEGYSAHSNPCFQKGSVFKCSLISE